MAVCKSGGHPGGSDRPVIADGAEGDLGGAPGDIVDAGALGSFEEGAIAGEREVAAPVPEDRERLGLGTAVVRVGGAHGIEAADVDVEEALRRVEYFALPGDAGVLAQRGLSKIFLHRGRWLKQGGELAGLLRIEDAALNIAVARIESSQHLSAMMEKTAQPERRALQSDPPFLRENRFAALLMAAVENGKDGLAGFRCALTLPPGGIAAADNLRAHVATERGKRSSGSS